MRYVGLDVHLRQSTFCVLDERGRKLMTRTVHGTWAALFTELARIKDPFAICFEASAGYGFLFERLRRIARRVIVAHPGHLRLIFRWDVGSERSTSVTIATSIGQYQRSQTRPCSFSMTPLLMFESTVRARSRNESVQAQSG